LERTTSVSHAEPFGSTSADYWAAAGSASLVVGNGICTSKNCFSAEKKG